MYEVQWFRVKADPSKLARKRWIENCSSKEIGSTYGLSPITVDQYLRHLKQGGDLEGLDLTQNEKANITEKWKSEEE